MCDSKYIVAITESHLIAKYCHVRHKLVRQNALRAMKQMPKQKPEQKPWHVIKSQAVPWLLLLGY